MNKKDIDYTCYLVTDHKDKTNEEILNIIEEALKGGTSIVLPIILVCLGFLSSFVLAGFIVSSEFFIMPDISNFL